MSPIRNSENMHLPKYKTNKTVRAKVDDILFRCARIFCNLGTGTSYDLKTIEKAKRTEAKWLKEIKELDPQIYERIKKDD
tara:strand:- start:262 stop:501 length:240 start_codon:yes stop_codon:yes gene_type:complete